MRMTKSDMTSTAQAYLEKLCSVKPNRRTGSAGNRAATEFFADAIRPFGYDIDTTPFDCLDHPKGKARLANGEEFDVLVSPYSLSADVRSELVAVATIEALEKAVVEGKLLLLHGAICEEQLMPKNFVFYNPDSHKHIISLLERGRPAAIIAATKRNPDLVGALHPFPLIVDGDFDIPSVYCRDDVGKGILQYVGKELHLVIDAGRIPSTGSNVVARLNPGADRKVVFTAHIDAYEDSPGASDNAAGTVVLMLCAGMLADYKGDLGVEIVALNGEDHYSAAGQMDYLKRYGDEMSAIKLVVNVDDAGYGKGPSAYSFYECPKRLENRVEKVLAGFDGLVRGEPWSCGDHMIFVQAGIPAVAFASELMPELMRTVAHTAKDTPDIVDCDKLVEVARSMDALVRAL